MRQYVTSISSIPFQAGGAYNAGSQLTFLGGASMTIFIETAANVLDMYDGFSSSQGFINAVNNDACVPSGASNINRVSGFMQV